MDRKIDLEFAIYLYELIYNDPKSRFYKDELIRICIRNHKKELESIDEEKKQEVQ